MAGPALDRQKIGLRLRPQREMGEIRRLDRERRAACMLEAQTVAARVKEAQGLGGEKLGRQREFLALERNAATALQKEPLGRNFRRERIFRRRKPDRIVVPGAPGEGPAKSRVQPAGVGHRPHAAIFDRETRCEVAFGEAIVDAEAEREGIEREALRAADQGESRPRGRQGLAREIHGAGETMQAEGEGFPRHPRTAPRPPDQGEQDRRGLVPIRRVLLPQERRRADAPAPEFSAAQGDLRARRAAAKFNGMRVQGRRSSRRNWRKSRRTGRRNARTPRV